MRALALLLLIGPIVACGGPAAGGPKNGARKDPSSVGSASIANDAGPSMCPSDPKEPKDLAPCLTDCAAGIVGSCVTAATFDERTKNYPRAVTLLERACEMHDPTSCVGAARLHANGLGVPPSRTRQIELLATACQLGDPFACNVPAKAFTNGSGVPKDVRRATELYQRACAGGQEDACERIADAGL